MATPLIPIPLFGKKKEADTKPQQDLTAAENLAKGMLNVKDIIAPSAIEVDFSHIKIGNTYYKTIFVSGYPRFVGANWLSPIINFDHSLDISFFYYPVKAKGVMDDLRKKITEMEATMMANREKGRINDPTVSIALDDAKALQEQLVKGVEKFFQFSFYITIPAESLEELNNIASKLESTLGSLLLISKTASLQMEDAFQSTIPASLDKLMITRNMDTTSLATTFPFTSSDLTMDDGILYGINRHNGSLVIFDRFSMENANTVVFAKSGSGKSYFVKLEALRSMVFGAEVLILDVEEEYKALCEAVGGNYISFSPNSPQKINPFDLSGVAVEGENELGQKLLSLHTLFKLMLGDLNPTEEAILDRALIETYRIKGITPDPETQRSMEPPVMEDLYKVLLGAEEREARSMAERLEKYIKGSMTGIFDSQSTIKLESKMTVFSTKNLQDVLRPVAFYIILDFVWTRIRKDLKKRIFIVEEAWYLMQNEDSARFIYGVAKRARKYYLGLTTISQDVDDFLASEYGKAIVTNSSIQVLLKQHPAAIEKVAETFYLSEGEKRLLLAADRGEGLFFAGANHIAIKIVASDAEHRLVTTNPAEILKMQQEGIIKSNRANGIPNEKVDNGPLSQMPYRPPVQKRTQDFTNFNTVPEQSTTPSIVGGSTPNSQSSPSGDAIPAELRRFGERNNGVVQKPVSSYPGAVINPQPVSPSINTEPKEAPRSTTSTISNEMLVPEINPVASQIQNYQNVGSSSQQPSSPRPQPQYSAPQRQEPVATPSSPVAPLQQPRPAPTPAPYQPSQGYTPAQNQIMPNPNPYPSSGGNPAPFKPTNDLSDLR